MRRRKKETKDQDLDQNQKRFWQDSYISQGELILLPQFMKAQCRRDSLLQAPQIFMALLESHLEQLRTNPERERGHYSHQINLNIWETKKQRSEKM